MAFLTEDQLASLGFRSLGSSVRISEKASLYGVQNISIGDHSRVDDFCILSGGSGGITIGSHVHISCYTSLIGRAEIVVGDFVSVSGRCSVYSSTDDFSGATMTGPTLDTDLTNVTHKPVLIGRHCIIGAGGTILPGVTIGEGVAVGAMSLVMRDCAPFGLYVGVPARRVKERSRGMLLAEKEYLIRSAGQRLEP
jgi:acetyltransferase-like isoleucine patch superfamily enzyme